MTKKNLADKIIRKFGYPKVKVELDQTQIYDSIDEARNKFIKWAVGQSTHEVFYTMMLSGGQALYDMPIGTTEIISYTDHGGSSGINTLFTIDNYLYQQGYYDSILGRGSYTGYNLISYHIARDFLDTVRKYSPSKYAYRYHPYVNQIELIPTPETGNSLTINEVVYDSPGFVLLQCYTIEGSTTSTTWAAGDADTDFYGLDWIFDYVFADCKERIGYIRRKFENFASIGNTGISLDGGDMVNEGKEEKVDLMERLKEEESYDGYPILIGY